MQLPKRVLAVAFGGKPVQVAVLHGALRASPCWVSVLKVWSIIKPVLGVAYGCSTQASGRGWKGVWKVSGRIATPGG